MADKKDNVKYTKVVKENSGAGAVYCLGLIGAAVYYVQKAEGFGEIVVALIKALLWPAYFVFEILGYINA